MKVQELYRASRRAAAVGIIISLSLGIAKVIGGVYGHSIALVSDSVHSLGDAIVSLVVWVALGWSQTPADKEHPYGHTRGEAVIGSNIALVLVGSAVAIAWEALSTIGEPSPQPESYALIIAGISVVLKESMFRYNIAVAKRTGSTSVKATAWDHRADALSSLVVLVALGLIEIGGPAFHIVDHLAAVLVAICIGWSGGMLFWDSLQELLDRQAEPAVLDAVRREAQAVEGVQQVEKLLVRKTGLEYLVDIHVEVDPELSVRAGHAIAHAVKDRIIGKVVPVKDVLVHVEPGRQTDDPKSG